MTPHVVIVPGIGGSGPDHWQSLWEAQLGPEATRIRPESWDEPRAEDWHAAIATAVAAAISPVVLVGHSLGCLATAMFCSGDAMAPTKVVACFLVAPPDPDGPAFPHKEAHGFTVPACPLPVPTLVVASADDPYASPGRSRFIARAWGAEVVEVGPHGHLNAASGLGDWPVGRRLLRDWLRRHTVLS